MQTPADSRRRPGPWGRARRGFVWAGALLLSSTAVGLLALSHADESAASSASIFLAAAPDEAAPANAAPASAAPANVAPGNAATADAASANADAALPPSTDSVLRIIFLDVGQGDAVLIQAPEGQTALVDAGPRDVVPLLRELGVERIDLLVATHPHTDHIGGMAGVIEALPVRFYMDNGDTHTTQTYRRLLAALDARPDIAYLEATPRTISLGSASIEVLPLLPRGTAGLNDRSVALVVRFGEFKAFLSGDSEVVQLSHLVGQRAVPDVELLKAAHHGSDNGFTWEFLRAATPEVVVISVGRNSYGHPRPEALAAYASAGAAVLRTDMHGHVEVRGHGDGRYDVASGQQLAALGTGGGRSAGATDLGAAAHAAAGAAAGSAAASAGRARTAANGVQLRLRVHADAPGNDNQNPNGEYAVLESDETFDRAIGGWRLCDAANHCFRFPPGAVLAAGGRIVVYTGPGQADGESYYMGYRRAVWNNSGDTATLYDRTGAAVVAIRY